MQGFGSEDIIRVICYSLFNPTIYNLREARKKAAE